MADWKFDGNEDSEGEEEDVESSWFEGGRTATVFLIDAAEEMFEAPEDNTEEEPSFHRAVRAAHATLMRKIISSDQDLVSLVLFNTRETKNPIDFAHVYILQELERPGAEKVLMLEKLIKVAGNNFDKDYGHTTNASLQDALRVCQNVFSKCTSRLSGQSILLFTCRDDPHSGDDQKKKQAQRKVQDLKEAGIVLEILHMGETFNVNKFYKDLIIPDESEDDEGSQEKITLADPTSRVEELMERVRRLDHKQRTTGRTLFTLAPGVEMSVGVYTAVRKTYKPYKVNLWKSTNEELRYMKKEYLEETGELLMPSDYVKYQTYGSRKIKFTLDEVRSMNRIYDPEIKLLGFKPISSIRPYHHIKPANFIYPDEKSVQGSNKMFAALLERCLYRKMAAIVRMVARKGASVSWAALIPQQEKLDDKNCQTTPPGFIACHLPFADDFRNIQLENTTRATPDQVDAAKAVIKKLHFKYSPDNFDNPDIQTHWRNIEALALNRANLEPVEDYSLPDNERIQKKTSLLLDRLRDLVYPPSYDPNEAIKKRPAPKSGPAPKKARPEPGSIDVESMAKAGKADKLTVDILKGWLQERGVKISGKKKAQLVQDVMDEVGV